MLSLYLVTIILVSGIVLGDERTIELERLRKEIKTLKDAKTAYNYRLEKLESTLRNLKKGNTFGKTYIQRRAGHNVNTVGFSARLSHDLGHLQDNQILVFDHVITNQGNRYDPRTGIFHCDEAGIYVFQLSVVAVPGAYVTTQIARNHQGEAWAFAMDPTNSSSGGTLVVLDLQAGDAVYARINGDHHGNEGRSITQQYTSFSGFRIQ